jgi:Na+/melibiose symporter-like transporter
MALLLLLCIFTLIPINTLSSDIASDGVRRINTISYIVALCLCSFPILLSVMGIVVNLRDRRGKEVWWFNIFAVASGLFTLITLPFSLYLLWKLIFDEDVKSYYRNES